MRPIHNLRHGIHLFRNRKSMWQMLRQAFRGQYKMSFLTMAALVLAIAYVIFPFDLIPDFIPVLGWIDDGLVIYLLLRRLNTETQRFNRFKAMERKG
jgi:uncharacterized membrane protein YkvA (DUF1232 family)